MKRLEEWKIGKGETGYGRGRSLSRPLQGRRLVMQARYARRSARRSDPTAASCCVARSNFLPEPPPGRLNSLEISRALWLVRFSGWRNQIPDHLVAWVRGIEFGRVIDRGDRFLCFAKLVQCECQVAPRGRVIGKNLNGFS